jgi:uncharacterized metal-binding protein
MGKPKPLGKTDMPLSIILLAIFTGCLAIVGLTVGYDILMHRYRHPVTRRLSTRDRSVTGDHGK